MNNMRRRVTALEKRVSRLEALLGGNVAPAEASGAPQTVSAEDVTEIGQVDDQEQAQAQAQAQDGDGDGDELENAYGEKIATLLRDAGYETVAAVAVAPDDHLLAIDGIGPKTVSTIREATRTNV